MSEVSWVFVGKVMSNFNCSRWELFFDLPQMDKFVDTCCGVSAFISYERFGMLEQNQTLKPKEKLKVSQFL